MSILIGHAASSETGTINGAKGDSTGKEVCIRSWYSKPWDFMAIHPDSQVRERHAAAIEAACTNNNIGYGQADRNTLNVLAKAVGYDLSRVGKCNCDCSSLQNVAAVASGANVTYGSNGWTTWSMKTALQNAGYRIIAERTYLENGEYCVRGAIYVNINAHTVAGLTNGSLAARTLEKAGIPCGNGTGAGACGSAQQGDSSGAGSGANFKIGDVVTFMGNVHYASANASGGLACRPGKARVTATCGGARHPYHLIAIGGSESNVYGWVNAGDIKTVSGAAENATFGFGDIVRFLGGPHYASANATNHGVNPKAGPARVTAVCEGAAHPYHVIHTNGESTVYGWVDADKLVK